MLCGNLDLVKELADFLIPFLIGNDGDWTTPTTQCFTEQVADVGHTLTGL